MWKYLEIYLYDRLGFAIGIIYKYVLIIENFDFTSDGIFCRIIIDIE